MALASIVQACLLHKLQCPWKDAERNHRGDTKDKRFTKNWWRWTAASRKQLSGSKQCVAFFMWWDEFGCSSTSSRNQYTNCCCLMITVLEWFHRCNDSRWSTDSRRRLVSKSYRTVVPLSRWAGDAGGSCRSRWIARIQWTLGGNWLANGLECSEIHLWQKKC